MDEEKRSITPKKVLIITAIILNIIATVLLIWYTIYEYKIFNKLFEERDAPYRSDIVLTSEEFVRDRLEAPETAEFPPWHSSDVTYTKIGKSRYEVTSYFDAENADGDTVRTYYVALLKYEGNDRWTLDSLEFN
jgi:hypothetical protein